jgi:oxygen-dependent protoporphyrinogen oxidase
VLHDQRLFDLPRGFRLLVPTRVGPLLGSPLFSYRGKLRILAERFVPRRNPTAGDETLRRFVSRRFGRELFERVAEPILGGLFTADADRLSLEMSLPRLRELERRYGSVSRGVARVRVRRGPGTVESGGFISLRSGLGSLVTHLAERLPDGSVCCDARLRRLRFDQAAGEWVLQAEGMEELRARTVILTCPAFEAARLLSGSDDRLCEALRELRYASCVTVNLGYVASQIRRPLQSYGFFIPRNAGLPLLACSHVSGKFAERAPAGHVLLRAFLGGALAPDTLDAPDDRLAQTAHETLRQLLGIEGGPMLATVHRYPRSMPQFAVGHRGRIDAMQERLRDHPGLLLAGAALGAVGLPDCIRSGERAAKAALSHVAAGRRRLELAI